MELREPFDGPRKLITHSVLILWLDKWQKANGKLSDDSIREWWVFFNRLLYHERARFSVRVLEWIWGAPQRKLLMKAIRDCPYIVASSPHCNLAGRQRCRTYTIANLVGVLRTETDEDAPQQMDRSSLLPCFRVAARCRGFITVGSDWWKHRAMMWRDYCITHSYPVAYDYDGSTSYGSATFRALASVALPRTLNWTAYPGTNLSLKCARRFAWMVRNGMFRRACFRIRGRLFHSLVSMPKWLRRKLLMLWNGLYVPVSELDMGSTYWVLNLLDMPECSEKRELELLLSGEGGDFYMEVDAASSRPYGDRKMVKGEFQKQCLFWKVWRHESEDCRPLWMAMKRRFPVLAATIDRQRRRMSGSELSDKLTYAESAFFVDKMLPMIHNLGIPVMTIHDCFVVPQPVVEQVKALVLEEARKFFGFTPKFSVTCGDASA